MKKNRMMRAASALLVAVLMTTCTISGTFAKYVTEASASDTARVAKWGVEVTATANAFADEYATDDTSVTTIAKSVVSVGAADPDVDKVIAPGTKGTLLEAVVKGAPEVAANVKKGGELTLTGWEIGGQFYCPLVITVDGAEIKGLNYTSASDFEAAVEGATKGDANIGPNLGVGESHTITWEWPFSTGTDNDVKDTALGNLATAPTITFDYKITVTQID